MRALILTAAVALVSACTSPPGEKAAGRIVVVNGLGNPVQGALILPEEQENPGPRTRNLSEEDRGALTSDAQGIVHADLEQYFSDRDGCYHFRIHRAGFEDVEMAVSRDLFPPLLRIRMEANPQKEGRQPEPAPPPAAPPAGRGPPQP